jgi:hypothetical protein
MNYKYQSLQSNGTGYNSFPGAPVVVPVILFIILLIGCNVPGKNGQPQQADSTIPESSKVDSLSSIAHADSASMQLITGEPLYSYYTDATTMFNLIPKNPGGNTKGKIVFQYLVNGNGQLTLAAFGGGQHSQGFNASKMVVMTTTSKPVIGISNNLFLCDQEMSKHNYNSNDDLTPLLDEIKKHSTATPGRYDGYISFTPSLVPFDVKGYQTIHYEVGWYPIVDDIEKHQSFAAIPGATLNPSPPRNAY